MSAPAKAEASKADDDPRAKYKIYKIVNTYNISAYIGLTIRSINKRWADHCASAKNSDTPISHAIAKYGKDAFKIEHIATAFDEESLKQTEKLLIAQESTHVSTGGYNVTLGGDGTFGWVPSLEVREKIRKRSAATMLDPARRAALSASSKAKWEDPEYHARCQGAMIGKVISAEHRAQISKQMKGRQISEAARKKQADAIRGKPRPAHVIEAIRRAQTGTTRTEAQRAAVSAAHKGKPKSEAWRAKAREAWVRRRERMAVAKSEVQS